MWKGGISFLSHQRGWIIRRSYCGHSRLFDVITAAGCKGGAVTNRRPGVYRWGLPPFAPLGKKDSLPLHWKSTGSPISADVVEFKYVAAMEAKKKKSVKFKSKTLKFFISFNICESWRNTHISGLTETGLTHCITAIIIGTKVRTGRKMGENRGSQEGLSAQILFHPLSLFIEL